LRVIFILAQLLGELPLFRPLLLPAFLGPSGSPRLVLFALAPRFATKIGLLLALLLLTNHLPLLGKVLVPR
jgi:hypothetical protein